jgi:lysozyme
MNIQDLLIKHEGLRLKPYTDTVGKLTIGVGRNLTDVGISNDETMTLLQNDINSATKNLQKNLEWFDGLPYNAKLVMIDMCFNMGIGGLLQFKNTLAMIQNGKYNEASVAMLQSKWATQVGNRAKEDSDLLKQIE